MNLNKSRPKRDNVVGTWIQFRCQRPFPVNNVQCGSPKQHAKRVIEYDMHMINLTANVNQYSNSKMRDLSILLETNQTLGVFKKRTREVLVAENVLNII